MSENFKWVNCLMTQQIASVSSAGYLPLGMWRSAWWVFFLISSSRAVQIAVPVATEVGGMIA